MADIRKKILELAESIAGEYGLELVDVELAGSMRKPIVRVFIDKEGGTSLHDCERFSKAISALLDVEDPIRYPYVLEVSSPGMDRPLKRPEDFLKSIGKLARVVTKEAIDKQNFFVGRITAAEGTSVTLSLDDKGEVTIPFEQISRARLEIEIR